MRLGCAIFGDVILGYLIKNYAIISNHFRNYQFAIALRRGCPIWIGR